MADSQQTEAWVATTSPLTVYMAGADDACPASKATSDALSVSTKVRVTVSSPLPPVVTGVMQ